jgi:multicomponent Na+:H+ antiporter subunit E
MLGRRMGRIAALSAWAYLVWIVVTWTWSLEQLVFGAVVALLVATGLAPLGEAHGPWWFFHPRRLIATVHLLLAAAARILVANIRLAIRIWSPRRPLSSGMVIVPTQERREGPIAAVGIITSLIVDNQITDVDRRRHQLQYHAVSVPPENRRLARRAINGPVEDLIAALGGER